MATEREVLQHIINNQSEGVSGLFERHAALFHDGLSRFLGDAGLDQAEALAAVICRMVQNLKDGQFDDVVETFYDWVNRDAWSSFMDQRIAREGGDHLTPEIIYLCADRLSLASLPDAERQEAEAHLADCAFCKGLMEQCKDVPVEVRTAGAPYPDAFKAVIKATLDLLKA